MSSRLKSKTMRALPWSFVESLINGIVGLAQTFVLTWFLSPDQMGRAAIALAIVGTVEIIATLGMGEAVIAASSSHTRITDTAFTGTMAATAVAMVLCWLIAGPVASLYGEPEVAGLLTLAILTLPFNNFVAVPTALFTRKMRAAVVTLRITMGRVMTLVAMAILAYFGYGAWAIVGGTVIGSAITAAVLLPAIARMPRLRFNLAEFKSLLVFGGALSFERLLWGAMTRLFWLIIGYLHGPAILGFFQFAQRLVDETANLIQTFSIRFGLSFFAGMKRAGRDPTEAFLKASRIIGVVAAPVFTGIAIVMPDAIGSIFAERWEPAVIVSQIVALGWIFAFPRVLVGPLLRAQGHVGAIVFYAMLASATTLIAGGLTGGYGLVVIGLAWIARHVVGVAWSLHAIKRYIGIDGRRQMSLYWRSLLATGLMAAIVIWVASLVPEWSHASRFALEVVVGAVSYAVLVLLIDRPSVALLRNVARGIRG
ncbi:oligosaccharide flippase family protein [Rhizobium daejeonense]|uniref:Oligosaccharide flippase family protein n=1 Tax=Rhizobium daejeonense TaxID=240521 RepID=A0A6M1RWI7_9HYPH|nr:oligosaccharide flippase family protein [Rhizobium daejeonense]NGO66154.1 oligosaccharide flippase family protein [Rhizobium daejeonense]